VRNKATLWGTVILPDPAEPTRRGGLGRMCGLVGVEERFQRARPARSSRPYDSTRHPRQS
jgi:hypothetical protein